MRVLFYFFIFIILFLQTFANNTIDPDYWARLLQGNAFLGTGSIMKYDPFSYIPTHFWIDHEWGASVIFAFIQNNFGFLGILTSKVLLVFFIYFLIFKTIRLRTNKNNSILNVLLFIISVYAMPSITQSGFRCHFFTFLFFTLFIYILEKTRKDNNCKFLLLLPPIFLIWCNIHGGCISGLGLLFLYTIGEFLNQKPFKNYLFTMILCLFSMFINPYGIDYVKFIFTAVIMPRPYITEWISPFLHPVWNFMIWFKILFFFYLSIILMNIKKFNKDFTKSLILFVCLILALKNIKSSPFFVIVSMIFLYENIIVFIEESINRLQWDCRSVYLFTPKIYEKIIGTILSGIFTFVSLISIKDVFFLSEQPYKIVEFLRINELKGNIIAPMDMGSYIAYKLYPDNLIFMDGRYEEVYYKETKELMDNFYNVKEGWSDILKSNPDFIIVPSNALVNDFLSDKNDYFIIFSEGENLLYSNKNKLKSTYKLPSDDYNYYLKTAFL